MNPITSFLVFACVILGSAEAAIAGRFVEAAYIYAGDPEALQLCAMNIIYKATKERGATILMPSAMVESMNPYGNTLGSRSPATRRSSQMVRSRWQSYLDRWPPPNEFRKMAAAKILFP